MQGILLENHTRNVAFITCLEDAHGTLYGFECENVLVEEQLSGLPNSELHNLGNYDMMEKEKREKFKRLKKLVRVLLSRRGKKNETRKKGASKNLSTGSVSPTVTSSTASVCSHGNLEGFIVKCVSEEDNAMTSEDEPYALDMLSDLAISLCLGTQNIREVDEETVCTEGSEPSLCSEPSTDEVCLMEQRLLATGLVCRDDFSFVADHVSKEVRVLKTDLVHDPTVSHVKTGVWQVETFLEDGTLDTPYYIVTGVSMDDRVDTKKLRKVLFAGEQHKRRPKLSMAPTEIAEELVGFQSGTMAPILHTQDMKLFLEKNLVDGVDAESHRFNVGSGMFGKCLSIWVKDFLKIAELNPKGFVVCDIIRKK